MSSRPIRFFHAGAIVAVEPAATTRTVLDWLRENARLCGTKEGCNEGDCGACTVVIGELAPAGAASDDIAFGLRLRSANACIQFLPTLDGKALFTVEDLRSASGALHPVQQSMVDCHASQCGFCTPGFVDTHVHSAQIDVIASYGSELLDWLTTHTFPAEARHRERTHAEAAAAHFLDALLAHGTTAAVVFPTVHAGSVDAIFAAAEARGMRVIAGKVLMDRNAPASACALSAWRASAGKVCVVSQSRSSLP